MTIFIILSSLRLPRTKATTQIVARTARTDDQARSVWLARLVFWGREGQALESKKRIGLGGFATFLGFETSIYVTPIK